jgi:hypothetical protein
MTVTDGRAGHFRTVSAVVRVRPGAVRQAVGHRPGDRGRAHGGQSAARSYSPGRLPASPRERRSTAAAAPQQFWLDQLWSSAPSTAHHGNDNGACPARPSRHTVCLGGCAPHISAASFGATASNCPSSRARQLAAISAHPAAMVGTGMPKLRGRTGNEAIVMPTAPSLERDSAPGRRTPGN